MKLLFIVQTPLHHLFVSHVQMKAMFLCKAMCKSRFSCMLKFWKSYFSEKTFFLKECFRKTCGSLTAALQGGTFSFALSIPFTALPMHCFCTFYKGDPVAFCITLLPWSALTNTFQPKESNNYFGS